MRLENNNIILELELEPHMISPSLEAFTHMVEHGYKVFKELTTIEGKTTLVVKFATIKDVYFFGYLVRQKQTALNE